MQLCQRLVRLGHPCIYIRVLESTCVCFFVMNVRPKTNTTSTTRGEGVREGVYRRRPIKNTPVHTVIPAYWLRCFRILVRQTMLLSKAAIPSKWLALLRLLMRRRWLSCMLVPLKWVYFLRRLRLCGYTDCYALIGMYLGEDYRPARDPRLLIFALQVRWSARGYSLI